MSKLLGHRVLVAMTISALTAAANAGVHSPLQVTDSTEALASDKQVAKIRATLEMNQIKPVVEGNMEKLRGMFSTADELKPLNELLAATATLRDRDSTNIRSWGSCHSACHGACHGARGWR
jgi:hypothetical protein